MSAEIINLNRFRKEREREIKQDQAAENRIRFGRTREEREHEAATEEMRQRALDGARLEPAPAQTASTPQAEPAEPAVDLDPGAVS